MNFTTDQTGKLGGKLDVSSVNVARLLSELEGSFTLLKYMGFLEDVAVLEEMKGRYYRLYFQKKKEERLG